MTLYKGCVNLVKCCVQGRPLRRASAIEGDIPTPCMSKAVSLEDNLPTTEETAEENATAEPESTQKTNLRLTDSQNSLLPNPETMC